MAWVLVNSTPDDVIEGQIICNLAANTLVYLCADDKVYSWDGVSETEILDASSLLTSFSYGHLAYFKGNVYLAGTGYDGATLVCRVWRYSGTPGVWAQVDSVTPGSVFSGTCDMEAIGNDTLLLVAITDSTTATSIRSSPDGATWGNEAISIYPDAGFASMVANIYAEGDDGVPPTGDRWYFDKAAGWAKSSVELSGPGYIPRVQHGAGFGALYARLGVGLYRSIDGGATWSNTGLIIDAADNVYTAGGVDFVSSSVTGNFYQWSAGAWVTIDASPAFVSGSVKRGSLLYIVAGGNDIYYNDTFIFASGEPGDIGGIAFYSMDIDRDGTYLYIAAVSGGLPMLVQINALLNADGTKVFDPNVGTVINVMCGNQDADRLWICGDFDGVNLVESSLDAGANWTVVNAPAWSGVAQPPSLLPNSDDGFMTATDADDDLHETLDGGVAWTTNNAALPFNVGALDRLDIASNEIIIGDIADTQVQYSPNNGATFHDISAGLPSGYPVTTVIVG